MEPSGAGGYENNMTHYDDTKDTFRCAHGFVRGHGRCRMCESITSESVSTFERAKFYACSNNEILTCRTPEEALAEFAASINVPLTERTPITVSAFAPRTVSDSWLYEQARGLLKEATDFFFEEFGDPAGDDDGLDEEAYKAATPTVMAALRLFYSHGRVWSCEKVAERIYDATTIERVLHGHRLESSHES
mgnify:FL=1